MKPDTPEWSPLLPQVCSCLPVASRDRLSAATSGALVTWGCLLPLLLPAPQLPGSETPAGHSTPPSPHPHRNPGRFRLSSAQGVTQGAAGDDSHQSHVISPNGPLEWLEWGPTPTAQIHPTPAPRHRLEGPRLVFPPPFTSLCPRWTEWREASHRTIGDEGLTARAAQEGLNRACTPELPFW